MPLFGRRAPQPGTPSPTTPPRPPIRVLRAAGARIDLTARDTTARLAATKQPWQQTALAYRNLIGEIRYAQKLRAQAVARCRFYVAATRPWPADPAPLDSNANHDLDPQLAADALVNFRVIPFDPSPDGFTARLDENLHAVGEAWIHIDSDQQWAVRSISEVVLSMDGRIALATLPGGQGQRPIDPQQESLLRCWVPDLEWSELADSPMRALLDVAEEVVLAGREMRAAARSRVAANGILLLPSSMSLVKDRGDDDGEWDDTVANDTFMADFTDAMLASLSDDGDAAQVVPIVLRGDIDDINAVKHLTLERADAERLIERQQAALLRLLHGLDVQPEQVEGAGGLNHWTAWQVDARSIKEQVQPAADTIAACLMKAWMRPALQSLGYSDDDIAKITIVADASDLAENPNRGQDARDAWDRAAISDEALRRELGFDEDDAPDEPEFVRRLAIQGRLPVEETAKVLGLRKDQPQTVDGQVVPRPELAPGNDGDRPVAQPGQTTPERPVPEMPSQPPDPRREAPSPLRAAGAPDDEFAMHVDEQACRALAAIDASLSQRVAVAADDALARVLERAGARVRSAAQRDRGLAAQLTNQDPVRIPAMLGRDKVAEWVQIPELIADEYTRLRGQVTGWLRDAGVAAGLAVCEVLGLNPHTPRGQRVSAEVTSRLAQHVDPAWQLLRALLYETAEWALFDQVVDDSEQGESSDGLLSPQDVADVLAVAGGDRPSLIAAADVDAAGAAFARDGGKKRRRPERKRRTRDTPGTGVATGPVVQSALAGAGAVLVGWEWDYRDFLPRKSFEPHYRLDGTRFATWSDPKLDTDPRNSWLGPSFRPGDHKGCLCGAIPIYAVLDDPEGIVARRLAAAKGDPRRVAVDQLAAADSAAGRVGTSAQQTAEIRRRLTEQIEAMRAEYIDSPKRRRRR